jgi:hypothetical protein
MHIQKIFIDNICFISGNHRSGKSLLTSLLTSLKKTEIINKEPLLYLIFSMYTLNEINSKTAKFLISFILSNKNYSNFIGRNINLKKTDETSIYNLFNKKIHLSKINNNKKINIKISENYNKKIIFYDVHNIATNLDFWLKINKKFKIINIERNPVDLVFSWYLNGFGNFRESSILQILTYKNKKGLIPFSALGFKKNYFKIKKMDRIINQVYKLTTLSKKNLNQNKLKKRVISIKYEDILKNPKKNFNKINKFLKNNKVENFQHFKRKINFKKLITSNIFKKKLNFIKNNSSDDCFKKIKILLKNYEK